MKNIFVIIFSILLFTWFNCQKPPSSNEAFTAFESFLLKVDSSKLCASYITEANFYVSAVLNTARCNFDKDMRTYTCTYSNPLPPDNNTYSTTTYDSPEMFIKSILTMGYPTARSKQTNSKLVTYEYTGSRLTKTYDNSNGNQTVFTSFDSLNRPTNGYVILKTNTDCNVPISILYDDIRKYTSLSINFSLTPDKGTCTGAALTVVRGTATTRLEEYFNSENLLIKQITYTNGTQTALTDFNIISTARVCEW